MTNRALFWLSTRNDLAGGVMLRYASSGGKAGGAMGVVGLVMPSGGVLSMIGDLAMQAPTVYAPMVRELTTVYTADSTQIASVKELTPATLLSLRNVDGEAMGTYLAAEFGHDFLLSMLKSMLPELGIGAATNLLPGALRALVGTGLDSALGATLTWRVGMMVVLFALNDWSWVQNKSTTNALARRIVGKPKPDTKDRVQLHDILQRLPHLHARAVASIVEYIKEWRRVDPTITESAIRAGLQRQGVSADLIEAALSPR